MNDQQIAETALAIRSARPNDRHITETALAIRSARAMQDSTQAMGDYLGTAQEAMNLALSQSNPKGLDSLRDAIVDLHQTSLEMQEKLVSSIADMVAALRDADPLVVNVPETKLTMEQQPVTVNVPKAAPIKVNPVIKVPQTKVVIEKPDRKVVKRAIIKHSDGTTSEIEFK